MSIYQEYKAIFFLRKRRENAFKNIFIKNWNSFGTFYIYNGVRYLDGYRISGDSVGAIKMAKTFHDREMNSRISDEDGVKSADLFFDFSKLVPMTYLMKSTWLYDYKLTMQSKDFDKIYYKIDRWDVLEAYFVKFEYGTDGKVNSEEKINDSFLNSLAWDLAEVQRLSYYDGVEIKFDTEDVWIEYDEEVSHYDISSSMNNFINDSYLIPSVNREKAYTLHYIYERIFQYAFLNDIDMERLEEYPFLYYVPNKGFMISLEDIKNLKIKIFLNLIENILDFKIQWTLKYMLKRVLTDILVFAFSVFLMFTGNIAGGLSLWTGYIGEMSNNKGLKILSSLLGIYSLGSGEEGFSFLNIGYEDAFQLLAEISSIYYSLERPNIKEEEELIDGNDSYRILYSSPFSIYSTIYEYEELISVSVENIKN